MAKKIKPDRAKPWINPIDSGLVNFLDYYDDKKVEKVKQEILTEFENAKAARSPYRDMWLEYYQLYRGYSGYSQYTEEWQSDYFVNMTLEIVETIKPRLMDALFSFPPLWIGVPERQEMQAATTMVEQLLDKRKRQTRLFNDIYNAISQMLNYGTAWMQLEYVTTPEYMGPKWSCADIFDVFPDSLFPEVESMRYIMRRSVRHIAEIELEEKAGRWQNTDKIKQGGSHKYFSHVDRLRTIGLSGDDASERDKDFHEVLEYFGVYYDKESKERFDVVFVMVDREHVVRFDECPYYFEDEKTNWHYALKPFVKFTDIQVPGETYGIGEVELIRYEQRELNDWRNLRADAAKYAVQPVYKVFRDGLENRDMQDVVFGPGSIIPVRWIGVDPVQPVQPHTGYMAAYAEVDAIKQEMRDRTGAQIALSGGEEQIRQTATQYVSKVSEANQRIKLKLMCAENGALSQMARMMYLMDRQFTDEEVLMQVFDPVGVVDFMSVTPTQLQWEGDFQLQPLSQYGMRGAQIARLMEFVKTLPAIPGVENMVNFPNLLQAIADSLEVKTRGVIKTPEEQQAAIQQQMAQQQQMVQAEAASKNAGGANGEYQPLGLSPEMQSMQPTMGAPLDDAGAAISAVRSQASKNAPSV